MTTKLSPRDLGLRSDSFYDGERNITERALISLEALEGVGKTDFCLRHTPDPIVVFNHDNGLEGVIEKFPKKTIIPAGVPKRLGEKGYPSYYFARPIASDGQTKSASYLETARKQATPVWEKFQNDFSEFQASRARTGVIDTGGAAFQLGRFAMIGTDKPGQDSDPFGKLGGQLNSIFQQMVTSALSHSQHVIWIHRLKEVWDSPGQFVAEGYKHIGYEVPIVIRLIHKQKETVARIMKCRPDREMVGEEFSGKDLRFPYIMAAITGTDEEEWTK